jgi:endonuclease-3
MNEKTKYFLSVFKLAEKKFGPSTKRLAGDEWKYDWQTLVATIMSAQTRDEVTIPVAENLFKKYTSLESLSKARADEVLKIIRSVNFSRVKAKHVVETARQLIARYNGKVPNTLEELITLPGVGRKTANLILSEVHKKDGITVDTHVHRIANVFGFVKTKTPTQTEFALMELAPKKYWSRINRIFVLWGKKVPGRDKNRFLKALE